VLEEGVSKVYNDATADFELVSQEGVRLRIQSFYLLAGR
jgi:hypothetical protein